MKKISFLILMLAAVSCSKDNCSGTELAGSYTFYSIEAFDCSNPSSNYAMSFSSANCATAHGYEYCTSGSMNFSADGTVTSTLSLKENFSGLGFGRNFNGVGTYVKNGSNITVCVNGCSDFRIQGNRLMSESVSSNCSGRVELIRR